MPRQKLVTIHLTHHSVEEHLEQYLRDSWRVVSIVTVGVAAAENEGANGWIAVLLEQR